MKTGITTSTTNRPDSESGVSHLIEYIIITGVAILLFVIMVPMANETLIERPTNYLTGYAYTDIGNGVSTRIIDLFAIIPYYNTANITTKFDIPDEVAGRDYWVEIVPGPPEHPKDNMIRISGGSGISSTISLAGIGETVFGSSGGRTTASGLNYIEYNFTREGEP
jgi:hypothetical protein